MIDKDNKNILNKKPPLKKRGGICWQDYFKVNLMSVD
jgi:hypothetical protein